MNFKPFLEALKTIKAKHFNIEKGDKYDPYKIRTVLQNLWVKAMGYEGPIDSLTFMEYGDYDDVATNGYLERALYDYRTYSISDYFQLSSSDFLKMTPMDQHSHIEVAKRIKKEELEEMERVKAELDEQNKAPKETDPRKLKQSHPNLQRKYEERESFSQQDSDGD